MYGIIARVTRKKNGVRENTGIATFFLDSDIQNITDVEHAERIAGKILNPFEDPNLEVWASAYAVERLAEVTP